MSKFIDAATTSHTVSVAAMEEASRFGQRTADIDHMFLALVINEQIAGQVLRSLGITLDSAREAVAAQHAEQIASLGIDAELPGQGRIVFHETGGYEWGERSIDIIKRASDGDRRGDASAVLRELVAEPSGLIEAVLHRLGTTPAAVLARLDEAEHYPVDARRHPEELSHSLSGARESFVPAPVDKVWELLVAPARMPEWEPGIGSVEATTAQIQPGDSWVVHAHRQRPDGKPLRIKPELRTQRVELVGCEPRRLIEWLFTYPDAPDANSRRVRVELEPAAGGTQLRLRLAWIRSPGRRRSVLGWSLRPLTRYSVWMHLSQLGGGISRVFR